MPQTLPPAIIVDVDGTLVDVSGVRHYVIGDPKNRNFDKFHGAAELCPPVASTVELVNALAPAVTVHIVTARKAKWEFSTRRWLRKWSVSYDQLHLRADNDNRKDVLVKTDILEHIRAEYRVVLAIDDNPAVIALWERNGIPTVIVPGWPE